MKTNDSGLITFIGMNHFIIREYLEKAVSFFDLYLPYSHNRKVSMR